MTRVRDEGDDLSEEERAAVHATTTNVTLIDAMLALTPEERLLQNDRMIQTIQE